MNNEDQILAHLDGIKRTLLLGLKNVWSKSEVALALGVTEKHIDKLIRDHNLPVHNPDTLRTKYFVREEVERWQTAHSTLTAQQIKSQAATYIAKRRLNNKH